MALTEKLCSNFCKELLDNSVISDESIVSCSIARAVGSKSVYLKVSTDEDDYNFTLTLVQNEETDSHGLDNLFLVKDEDIAIAIEDVAIEGYNAVVPEEVDVVYLKSILKSLALVHSKSIEKRYFKKVAGQAGHSLRTKRYLKLQTILRDFIERSSNENLDRNLLREGIEKFSRSSEDTLSPKEENVYVRGNTLQNKLFLKTTEKGHVKCKIINVAASKHLPLVYDVLLAIFWYSDPKLRQHHFHELTDYYYSTLGSSLQGIGLDLASILSPRDYELQIKSFIPYAKLEIAYSHCKENIRTKEDEDLILTAILELYECILYPNLTREDCYRAIRNKLGTSEYQLLNWTVTALEDRPGFLGDYFKLKINVEHESGEKILNMFAKYLPTTYDVAKEMAIASFEKEKFFYETFINELKSLGLEEITDFLPKCYFSRSNDVLIFEDLSVLNYTSINKTKSLPYETVLLLIKKLARLHACSLLYEEMTSEKVGNTVRLDDHYKEYLKEMFLHIDEINNSTKIAIVSMDAVHNYILDAFPDIPKEITMESFKEKVQKAFDVFFQKVKKCDKYRNVICQGDFWGGNFLFRRDESDNLTDCCIVDYQLTRYCPPTHDLFFLIYVNCDKDTRNKYMQKFIDEYYNELSAIVKRYNFDVNNMYTYQQFLDCCDYMKSTAVCLACFYLPIVMCPPEQIQEYISDGDKMMHIFTVDRKEMIDLQMRNNEAYRERIRGIVEDLYEVCVNDEM